jgi:membrane associated rhomboid family serine protease
MSDESTFENPFNTIPPVILILAMAIGGIELVLTAADNGLLGGKLGVGWRIALQQDYAFAPAVWDQVVDRGNWSLDMLRRFVTYSFIHANFTHALFAVVIVLAMGKFVGERWRQVSLVIVFIVAGIAGAAVYGATAPRNLPLIGAYPALYGLIGAYTYVMWLELRASGQQQWRAFSLIAMLLGLQLVFGLIFGEAPYWTANVAGFFAGVALSPLLGPGGWKAFVARVRERTT